MTAQKGKDLLLKVDSDGGGTFVTLGGLRARQLAFNAGAVDATDQESAGRWRSWNTRSARTTCWRLARPSKAALNSRAQRRYSR